MAPELPEKLEAALRLAGKGIVTPEELVRELGEGWVAEEALAVALYSVLATIPSATAPAAGAGEAAAEAGEGKEGLPSRHFRDAVALAVNHSGDSDSTGSIAGNILGACYGEECLPAEWLGQLEAPEVIRAMAEQLAAVTSA